MPPANPEKIPCPSLVFLEQELEQCRQTLAAEETEDNWDHLARALQRLGAVVRGGGYKYPSELVLTIKQMSRPIIHALNSERTRLSGAATSLLVIIAPRLKSDFEPLLHVFVPPLLRLCTRTSKVYITRAREALDMITDHTYLAPLIPFLRETCEDKSTSLRVNSIDLLVQAMNKFNPPDLARYCIQIEEMICIAATDKDANVREKSRKVFEAYKILWPERLERYAESMTPVTKRYLELRTHGTGESSNILGAREAGKSARPQLTKKPSQVVAGPRNLKSKLNGIEPNPPKPQLPVSLPPVTIKASLTVESDTRQPQLYHVARRPHPRVIESQEDVPKPTAGPSRAVSAQTDEPSEPVPDTRGARRVIRTKPVVDKASGEPGTLADSDGMRRGRGAQRVLLPPKERKSESELKDIPSKESRAIKPPSQAPTGKPIATKRTVSRTQSQGPPKAVATAKAKGDKTSDPLPVRPASAGAHRGGLTAPTLSQLARMKATLPQNKQRVAAVKASSKAAAKSKTQVSNTTIARNRISSTQSITSTPKQESREPTPTEKLVAHPGPVVLEQPSDVVESNPTEVRLIDFEEEEPLPPVSLAEIDLMNEPVQISNGVADADAPANDQVQEVADRPADPVPSSSDLLGTFDSPVRGQPAEEKPHVEPEVELEITRPKRRSPVPLDPFMPPKSTALWMDALRAPAPMPSTPRPSPFIHYEIDADTTAQYSPASNATSDDGEMAHLEFAMDGMDVQGTVVESPRKRSGAGATPRIALTALPLNKDFPGYGIGKGDNLST